MEKNKLSRRRFVAAAAMTAAACAGNGTPSSGEDNMGAESIIRALDDAWARNDVQALTLLHAEDAVVVNRGGLVLAGRSEVEKAMSFLHSPGGPFHGLKYRPQEIFISTLIGNDLVSIHTRWYGPKLHPDGTVEKDVWDNMIASTLVVRRSGSWQILRHDLHNIEGLRFPFPTKWNS
jgi:hypothetical protein